MHQDLQKSPLNETGFKAYTEYLALKRHFTSSYDYHKYNGKVNASFDSFLSRRDAYSFQRLGKQRDYKNVILSNMVTDPKIWVGSLLEETARQKYLEWKKIQDSITSHIQDALDLLDDDFHTNFAVSKGQYPLIAELYLQRKVSLESLSILAKITNSIPYWQENVVDKVVFPDIVHKIDKYYPFINYSPEKSKKLSEIAFSDYK